jgi:hypothetical protein
VFQAVGVHDTEAVVVGRLLMLFEAVLNVANAAQVDMDGHGKGDACDAATPAPVLTPVYQLLLK